MITLARQMLALCLFGLSLSEQEVLAQGSTERLSAEDAKLQALSGDLYGDPLPPGAVARLGTVRFRTGSGVFQLLVSPDGKNVVSRDSGNIRLWEFPTGKPLKSYAPLAGAPAFTFLKNGKSLAILSRDDKYYRWDFVSGQEPPRLPPFATGPVASPVVASPPDNEHFSGMAVSSDGSILASGSAGAQKRKRLIRLWDLTSDKDILKLKKVREFGSHDDNIFWLAFSSDDRVLASASCDGTFKNFTFCIWNTTTGKELARLRMPDVVQNGPLSAALSPDGRMFAAGTKNGTIHVWASTGKELHGLKGHTEAAGMVAFSPDGRLLASGGWDQTIRLWDTASGKELRTIPKQRSVIEALAFTPDGRTLVAGGQDYQIRLWDTHTGAEILPKPGHQFWAFAAALSCDGNVAATGAGDATIRLWQPRTGREIRTIPSRQGWVGALVFSPDGQTLISGSWGSQPVRCWDASSGKEVLSIPLSSKEGHRCGLALSPDGKTLAFVAGDGTVPLWDLPGRREIRRLRGTEDKPVKPPPKGGPQLSRPEINSPVFSPDGKTLAFTVDEETHLWDWAKGKKLRRLVGHKRGINALAFSADGKYLASGSMSQNWGYDQKGNSVASPDGSDAIHLWNVTTGQDLRQFPAPTSVLVGFRRVSAVAFSNDGRTLISAEHSGELVLYELATGKPRRVLKAHQAEVNGLAVSSKGALFVSVSSDFSGLIWDLKRIILHGTAPAQLEKKDLEELWTTLSSQDAVAAYQAMGTLLRDSAGVLALFKDRLRPVTAADVKRIPRLLADLGSPKFAVRQEAYLELEKLVDLPVPACRRMLNESVPLEVRQRLERLVKRATAPIPPPTRLREVRALEILEYLETPQTRRLLEALAGGTAQAWLTEETHRVLGRLARKKE
jgi:WD40 repeat protein